MAYDNVKVDTRDGLRKGGDSGPAITPGDPKKSLLVKALKHADDKLKMPPKERLADDVIERVYQDPSPAPSGRRGEALTECIDTLEGRAAEAVKGHYFDGVKLSDLADRMGMTSVAMRQLLHRVRVLLLECVRRRLSVENPS